MLTLQRKNYQYLIFSFSGVLYTGKPHLDEEAHIQFIQDTYQQGRFKDIPTTEDIMSKMKAGLSIASIIDQLSPQYSDQLFNLYSQRLDDAQIEQMTLTKNAHSLLANLKKADKTVIIVDFLTPDIVRKGIKKLGIEAYIDCVIDTQPSGEWRKGQPKVFDLIKARYPDITQDNTAVVGHQNADLNFSKAVQIDSFWLQNAGGDFKMCQSLPTYTVQSLLHLPDMLGLSLDPEEKATSTSAYRA